MWGVHRKGLTGLLSGECTWGDGTLVTQRDRSNKEMRAGFLTTEEGSYKDRKWEN